jgi:type IV pilus assembly protein PilB
MATAHGPRRPIGQILLESGKIRQEQLDEALNVQKNSPSARIGSILVDLDYTTQQEVDRAVAAQLGLEYLNLEETPIDSEAARMIPQSFAVRHNVFPIRRKPNNWLVVAMADPTDVFVLDDIKLTTGCDIEPVLASKEDLTTLIKGTDGQSASASGNAAMQQALTDLGVSAPLSPVTDMGIAREEEGDTTSLDPNDAPIIRLINILLSGAIQQRASDIHIEPERRQVRVRYRIDGILHQQMTVPQYLHAALISRVKIMSELNIAERRIPQDGHIRARHEGRDFDIRVSTIPTIFGEKCVMRLLEQGSVLRGLEQLGFFPDTQANLELIITQPNGIFLSTGPTGAGKSTTQCAVLNKLVTPEINIVTVEDPVEYVIPGVNQVLVNRKAGMTFASAMRSFLRQDPDIIMIGEIRDLETAETAIQASLTGHLVLSTLHTNDAPTSVTRLVDMGIDPFLVSASLIGTLAQRLARRICKECKETYKPPVEALARLGIVSSNNDVTFYRGRGCESCRHTGYSGRIGIYELMMINNEIRDLIVKRVPLSELRAAARAAGMKTLKEDGIAKVTEGITTIEEVMRVVFTAGE